MSKITGMVKSSHYVYRCLAYQEANNSFTGVCLDLDLVEEGHETLEQAVLSIHDAVESHLKAASEISFSDGLMYRPAPKKYWDMLRQLTIMAPQKIRLPEQYRVFPMSSVNGSDDSGQIRVHA